MPIPEEVDEIDSYLKIRKQRQAKGEIPKTDYAPPFVKKFGMAIFGKKPAPPKPALQSMQPTYVSPEAQAAMRKQLEEVVKSKESPTPKIVVPVTTPPQRVFPSGEVKMPALAAKPTPPLVQEKSSIPIPVTLPPKPAPSLPTLRTEAKGSRAPLQAKPATLSPLPAAPSGNTWGKKDPSLFDRFRAFMHEKPRTSRGPIIPPQAGVIPPAGMKSSPPASPSSDSGKKPLQPVVPLVSVARRPGYTPIEPIASIQRGTREENPRGFAPIPGVGASLPPRGTISPTPFSRDGGGSPTPPASAGTRAPSPRGMAMVPMPPMSVESAPPWVQRKVSRDSSTPASISEIMKTGTLSDLPWISAREAERQRAYDAYMSKKNASASPASPQNAPTEMKKGPMLASEKIPGPESIARTPSPVSMPSSPVADALARTPTSSPGATDTKSKPVLKPWVSGEVKVEPRIPPGDDEEGPMAAHSDEDRAREEELTEEEALERLPFEDVEGLSDSDLDYLARKEREHQEQRKKLEEDYVAPNQLKTQLEHQTIRMQSVLQDEPAPGTDEKQEILRRLKKMMEEDDSFPPAKNPAPEN